MALSSNAKEILVVAMANRKYANEVSAAIDAGSADVVVAQAAADAAQADATQAIADAAAAQADADTALGRVAANVAVISPISAVGTTDGSGSTAALATDVDSRLSDIGSKIDAIISALKTAGLMA